MPVVGLSLEEAVVFTELEDGSYPCTVLEFSEVIKGPKSNYLKVTMAVSEGHENAGAHCWTNLMIDGKGAGIFVNFLNAAMGEKYTIEEYRDEGIEVDTDDMVGAEVTVIIKQVEYPEDSGEMRAQVKQILPPE